MSVHHIQRVWGLPGVFQVNSDLASVIYKPSSICKHIIPADITNKQHIMYEKIEQVHPIKTS